jgi:hypothetical protein
MPSTPPPPQTELFRLERFRPEVHRAETQDYTSVFNNLSQSTFWKVKYGLLDADVELERISGIEANWDSYGAEPPSATAISVSRAILAELAGSLILPSAIVPSAEGGVSIYFMSGDRSAYVETDNQGAQALVLYDQLGNTEVLELGVDVARSEVGNRILGFLG